MPNDPNKILRKRFHLRRFRKGQKAAIDGLRQGRDAMVVMPTGYGKSIIFQVAAFCRPGVTLVISPLIALMTAL